MSPIWQIIILLYRASWILVPAIFLWGLGAWRLSEPKVEMPAWRSYLAYGSFGLGGASALLWFALALWSLATGGFRHYDPFLLRSYAVGLLLGLVGFALGLPGKGRLRWPACLISLEMVFMWFVTASME